MAVWPSWDLGFLEEWPVHLMETLAAAASMEHLVPGESFSARDLGA